MNDGDFVAVADEANLQEGQLLGADVAGQPVVLCRHEGTVYAIGAVCTHRQANLAEGELRGGNVVCPLHASEFDLKTGAASAPPATEAVPAYDVKIEGGKILVSISPRS